MPKIENCFVKRDIGYWLVSGSNRGPNIAVSTIYLYYIYIYNNNNNEYMRAGKP